MIFLCKKNDIPANGVRRIVLPRRPALAVYNVDGRIYATADRCPHGNASLADGEVEDGLIICPLHFGSYDVATGEAADPPCTTPVKTYQLTVEGDDVFLAPDEEA